jgi:two-component system chemotaxis response regulator CheB
MSDLKKIVVIGASAGGVSALCQIVSRLPADLDAAILAVVHIGERSELPNVLRACGCIPASHAVDGGEIEPGRLYLAPPSFHLLVEGNHTRLSKGPRENRFRPSVDVLFRSAARSFRSQVLGVVLTGELDDGSAGLHAISVRGGTTIVQSPDFAECPSMPRNAMRYTKVDYCVPLEKIAPLIASLTRKGGVSKVLPKAAKNGKKSLPNKKIALHPANATPFTCPECSGPLYQSVEGKLVQFSCNVGHAFSPEALSQSHCEALERALWIAVRTLNERQQIASLLSKRNHHKTNPQLMEKLQEEARQASNDVHLLQDVLSRL